MTREERNPEACESPITANSHANPTTVATGYVLARKSRSATSRPLLTRDPSGQRKNRAMSTSTVIDQPVRNRAIATTRGASCSCTAVWRESKRERLEMARSFAAHCVGDSPPTTSVTLWKRESARSVKWKKDPSRKSGDVNFQTTAKKKHSPIRSLALKVIARRGSSIRREQASARHQ